jgi:DnaJ-class molecular chaperone
MTEILEINTNTKNYYDELGLTEDATDEDLEKAFEMAQQKFSRQLTAYNALKNARKVVKKEIKEEYECIEVKNLIKI